MNAKVCKEKSVRLTYRLALLTLFLCVFSGAKAQDFSGYWFIASNGSEVGSSQNVSYGYDINTPETNYYLRPAADPQQTNNIDAYWYPVDHPENNDPEKPFLTSNRTNYDLSLALWQVVKTGDCYFIIHVESGKYVKCEPCISGTLGDNNNSRRKSMHLEACATPPTSDDFKFRISYSAGDDIQIVPERVKSKSFKYWNISDRNQPYNNGRGSNPYWGGLVGLYNSNTEINSKWRFEEVPSPDINFDAASGSYTITWHGLTVSQFPSEYKIRYTEDGNDPTISSTEYDGSTIVVENDNTTVKAILTGHGQVLSGIATQVVNTAAVAAPTFEVTCDSKLQINCNVSTATIYYSYTTDGTTEPDDPSNDLTNPNNHHYEGPISGFLDDYKVKAIAYNGSHASDVSAVYTFYNNTAAPSVTLSENVATVTFGSGVTIYYTTDGSHPFPGGNTATQSPHDITGLSYDVDVDIRVVATSPDHGNSCPVTVVKRPKQPTINPSNACVETNKVHSLTFSETEPGKTYWYALSNGSDQPAPDPDIFTYTEYTPGSTVDIAAIPAWSGTDIWVTLHAYAMTADGFRSHLVSENYMLKYTDAPSITYVTGESVATVTITSVDGATILYTVDGGIEQTYNSPFTINNGYSHTIIATAKKGEEGKSCPVTKIVRLPVPISSLSAIIDENGAYDLIEDIDDASSFTGFTFGDFTGSLNGNNHTISKLKVPLFNVINGGTVNNLFFDDVAIDITTDNSNVGTVCGKAMGASRIYNCGVLATNSTVTTDEDGYTIITDCSSTISGTSYVGGIVGLLKDDSRVINCFSYANITGGNVVGGIVGRNDVATTSGNLKTMVMNCMFYGDITGGNSRAPIYNGQIIKNSGSTGVSNFNYFWSGASYVQNKKINVYNCALAAETRYLQRFEFFRQLLNSHRELAAWWATGSRDNKDVMLKWVMEPSQIGTSTPYPILKTPGKYPSVVNFTPSETPIDANNEHRNEGRKLGTLTVHIEMGSGAVFGPPTGAEISMADSNHDTILIVTDKDPARFNFNYGKVQLPYYNDVGTKNYTGNRVVTGWKIVSITDGTPGTYTSTGSDVTFSGDEITVTPYNFADRHCTNKDLYGTNGSNRVFSQGAYWDVPDGVTAITIQPYWAKAAYVADAYADVVYDKDMTTRYNVSNVGGGNIYENNTSYSIAGDNQIVYTSISNAIASTALAPNTNHTVNDYAVVLVGNCHQVGSIEASKPYTLTSIDLDHDNEPDYALILRFNGRTAFHPVKYDFVALVGLGMAQKSAEGKGSYNFGIPQPKGWFELTNTSLFRVTQFEYGRSDRAEAPYILQGGVIEQWVSGQSNGNNNKTTYFHVGGNVWFKEFHLGCHQDKDDIATKHPPVSVTGGDFDAFYLTGLYATTINFDDDAECYINGGRFGTMAGTGMEGVGNASTHANGNITWIIDNADIKEFFAGGINAAKIAEGNLYTRISNSHVGYFYGGPKFGDMNPGRTVKTTADKCTFDFFFGAGYAGNSYYTAAPGNFTDDGDQWYSNDEKPYNLDWDKWVKGEIRAILNGGNYSDGTPYKGYWLKYIGVFGGVSTAIDYQFLPHSNNQRNVGRLFVKFVKFSLATTRSVTSTLTGCTINNSFYGGGSLGKVEGDVVSTLDGCTVRGDVFGAGYSATIPTVPVMDRGGFKAHEEGQVYPYYQPYYDKSLGVYLPGKFPNTVDYTWKYDPDNYPVTSTETAVDSINHILYTTVDLDKRELGSVKGNVRLIIKGHSTVFGSVFGGGEESLVVKPENTDKGNTEVQIFEQTKVVGNIYGGGNMGEVEGNTKVIVNGQNNTGTGTGSGNNPNND